MGAFRDLAGMTFGRLSVIDVSHRTQANKIVWNCKCECGNNATAQTQHLLDGRRVSCGCAKRPETRMRPIRYKTHNKTNTTEFRIWTGIKTRCFNKNDHAYVDYGGRGITMCERWKDSFDNFLSDMGERPKGKSLDRIDNNKGYFPDNCRWATQKQQCNNKRNNTKLTFNGELLTITEWSARTGINKHTLADRVRKSGWSHEDALTLPIQTSSDTCKRNLAKRWHGVIIAPRAVNESHG